MIHLNKRQFNWSFIVAPIWLVWHTYISHSSIDPIANKGRPKFSVGDNGGELPSSWALLISPRPLPGQLNTHFNDHRPTDLCHWRGSRSRWAKEECKADHPRLSEDSSRCFFRGWSPLVPSSRLYQHLKLKLNGCFYALFRHLWQRIIKNICI